MEAPLVLPVSTSTAAAGSPSISVADKSPPPPPPPPPPPDDDDESSAPSTQSIVFRVVAVLVVACLSLFAQHEASKGFRIDVEKNGAHHHPRDDAAVRRFHLFFVANGRAERILHRASRGVERALFPDASFPRKRVARVTVRMMTTMAAAGHNNLTAEDAAATVVVAAAAGGPPPRGRRGGEEEEYYVISLSPGLLMSSNSTTTAAASEAAVAVAAAIRRAVARMWLWDGRGAAPARVTESMVEYLASSGGDGDGEPIITITTSPPAQQEQLDDGRQQLITCMSARFLRHLKQRRSGFVARLNRAMRDRWSDAAVDAALGAPARPVCAAYLEALAGWPDSTSDSSDGTRGSSSSLAM